MEKPERLAKEEWAVIFQAMYVRVAKTYNKRIESIIQQK